MHVLVSNDDGVDAPGIRQLSEALRAAGHRVTVVAPDRDRSGASNSLTLDQPIRALRRDEHTWSIAGTPTDCVHLALSGMLDGDPDIVFSGINHSSNLGHDVIHSGTCPAAEEGRVGLAMHERHRNERNERFMQLHRGDVISVTETEPKGDGLALDDRTEVRIVAPEGKGVPPPPPKEDAPKSPGTRPSPGGPS